MIIYIIIIVTYLLQLTEGSVLAQEIEFDLITVPTKSIHDDPNKIHAK